MNQGILNRRKESVQISVVIPLFNGADKIEKCLSLLDQQTFSGAYEVIVVDDCSTDNSIDVVQSAIKTFRRPGNFKLIHHSVNGRAGKARNTGVKNAIGDYILYIDQDDYPDITLLDTLYSLTEDGYYDCTYCDIMDKDGREYHRENVCKLSVISHEERLKLMLKFGFVFSMLLRRKVLVDNNLWFPEKVMFEDALYNIGILACINSINGTNQVLYYRTDDKNSQTSTLNKKKLSERINASTLYLSIFASNPKIQKFQTIFYEFAFYYIYLSNVWWMILDRRLYTKELFERALKSGRELHVNWDSVMKSQNQLKPIPKHILKIVYYAPWTIGLLRIFGSAYSSLKHLLKGNRS